MSVVIDREKCIGCTQCANVCPGNLIRMDAENKATIPYPEDCWDCMSCMKACPKKALSFRLAPEFGGKGSVMRAWHEGRLTHWEIKKTDGSTCIIITDADESNQY